MNDMPLPAQVTDAFSPATWSRPLLLLAWGFALQFFLLQFLYLHYILPTVGTALLYLGFRRLRLENRAFTWLYRLSILALVHQSAQLILLATPFAPNASNPLTWAFFLSYTLYLGALFLFSVALQQLCKATGTAFQHQPALQLFFFQLLFVLVALFVPTWLLALPALVLYFCILRRLYRLGLALDASGFAMQAAPARLPTWVISLGYPILCLAAVLLTLSLSYHQPPKASLYTPPQLTAAREHLQNLGLAPQVLQSLPESVVTRLQDAISLETQATHFTTSGYYGSRVWSENANDLLLLHSTLLTLSNGELYALYHLSWSEGVAYWDDSLLLTLTEDTSAAQLAGELLYEKDGQHYRAPLPSLQNSSRQSDKPSNPETYSRISAKLSYPFSSNQQNAYLLFAVIPSTDTTFLYTFLHYAHMNKPLRYPYIDTLEASSKGLIFPRYIQVVFKEFNAAMAAKRAAAAQS